MELPEICKTVYDNRTRSYTKYYKCNKCDYTCSSLWNLKKHTAGHKTIKEKIKLPFYCKICDDLSVSDTYYEKHLKSTIHLEKIINKDIKNYIDRQIDARMKEYEEKYREKYREKE